MWTQSQVVMYCDGYVLAEVTQKCHVLSQKSFLSIQDQISLYMVLLNLLTGTPHPPPELNERDPFNNKCPLLSTEGLCIEINFFCQCKRTGRIISCIQQITDYSLYSCTHDTQQHALWSYPGIQVIWLSGCNSIGLLNHQRYLFWGGI